MEQSDMNYNSKAHRDVVAKRRQTVASLRLRRLSETEIVNALIELRLVNAATDRPWSAGTVHSDIEVLNDEWRATASSDIRSLQSELLAALDEVSRCAWQSKDLQMVLTAHKQKCDMLGLNAPMAMIVHSPAVIAADLLDGINLKLATLEELACLESAVQVAEQLNERSQAPALLITV